MIPRPTNTASTSSFVTRSFYLADCGAGGSFSFPSAKPSKKSTLVLQNLAI
nr:MAG TPA: hypothetical protein [Caudoviricetes sp.]